MDSKFDGGQIGSGVIRPMATVAPALCLTAAFRSRVAAPSARSFADTALRPRRAHPREFCLEGPALCKQRAQGMPGARCARSLVCEISKAYEHSHHGHTGITRHSLRNGFNKLLRALPGDRAFLPPSPAELP